MELSPLALAGVFLSGLALNLTPCVYPIIPVTVTLFSHSTKDLRISFIKAFLYVTGMGVMYSSLGLSAALTGGLFGAVLQNPVMLFGIALFMFVLALGMFGLYDLFAPSFILNWVSGKKVGYVGIFLSGAFVGLFAAPCVGPFVIGLLTVVAQSGDPIYGFIQFFVLSLGLGFPYLIFGTFAGSVKKLPKAGEWLIWVKKLFGFVLLERALFYFNLAFYSESLPFGLPFILLIAAIYLGFIDKNGNKNIKFLQFKRYTGIIAGLIGVFLLFGKTQAGVVWEAYSPQKLTQAQVQGKPAVIDFYADWCLPCHELEQYTYTDPEVIAALESYVRLKVDATNPETDEALEPIDRFEILGVPTVLFLDPSGKEIPKTRITGFVPASEFLKVIKKAESD